MYCQDGWFRSSTFIVNFKQISHNVFGVSIVDFTQCWPIKRWLGYFHNWKSRDWVRYYLMVHFFQWFWWCSFAFGEAAELMSLINNNLWRITCSAHAFFFFLFNQFVKHRDLICTKRVDCGVSLETFWLEWRKSWYIFVLVICFYFLSNFKTTIL